jgi:cystathionine beta-lyase/cystathionine gamma-synthase
VEKPRPDTAAVRSGTFSIPVNSASSPPLYQASSYEFADLDEVAAIYGGERPGRIYGRYGGPNGAYFESAIAELEGAEEAAGAASGMAAIDAALKTNLAAGEAIVATSELYGGTFALLENDYQKRGIRVAYVDQSSLDAVRAALEIERPRILYLEALTNPLMRIADLPALCALAREYGALSVVDATFASPVLIQPLAHGADLVVHSAGKYLGGHGDVGAGVLSGRAGLVEPARAALIRSGATIPHFEAWLALRGVRTLALRMARHSMNAVAVAAALAADRAVKAVHHPSRPEHPQHALAERLYPRGTGGIVAFDLRGGAEAVDRFLRGLRTIPIVHSLGEVATTISYPAVSSHRALPPEVRRRIGVGEGTLRISVGIEDQADLVAEIEGALAGLSAHGRA